MKKLIALVAMLAAGAVTAEVALYEYMTVTGTANNQKSGVYTITDYIPKKDTIIRAKYSTSSLAANKNNQFLFCSRKNTLDNFTGVNFSFAANVSGKPRWDYDDSKQSSPSPSSFTYAADLAYELEIKNGIATLTKEGESSPAATYEPISGKARETFTPAYKLCLFQSYTMSGDTYTGFDNSFHGRFYYLKVFELEGGVEVLKHWYVPCTEDGVVKICDLADDNQLWSLTETSGGGANITGASPLDVHEPLAKLALATHGWVTLGYQVTPVSCGGTAETVKILAAIAPHGQTMPALTEIKSGVVIDEVVSVEFNGLSPLSEYDYQIRIENGDGDYTDLIGSITTLPLPVPTISSVTVDTVLHDTVMLTVSGESIADVEVKVDLVEGGEIRATKTEDAFGEFVIEGLTPETTYTVKVTATNQYGPSVDESMSFTTLERPADEWTIVWDDTGKAGTVSWSKWKFNVTLAKDGTLAVGLVTEWPDSVYPLDFSLPIKDGEGKTYVISTLNPQFCDMKSGSATKRDPSPCAALGLLTLPGEGLVTIGAAAFAYCVNAENNFVFPTTLTSIGSAAFDGCVNLSIDGESIPAALTKIEGYCFRNVEKLSGDIALPNVTSVEQAAFSGTGISSVSFGPGLTTINGGTNERGAFQGCTSLTNVMFDAMSEVRIEGVLTFKGCAELEVLDLSPVVSMALSFDRNSYSHITGCSKLKKIIFGAGLTKLKCNALAGAAALEEIFFEGVPPVELQTPFLSPYDQNGTHATGYDNKTITTYVHRKLVNEKNEAGMCWADYAANGKISQMKRNPANNTTWAAEYVYEGIDLSKRQLLTIEAPGLTLLFL